MRLAALVGPTCRLQFVFCFPGCPRVLLERVSEPNLVSSTPARPYMRAHWCVALFSPARARMPTPDPASASDAWFSSLSLRILSSRESWWAHFSRPERSCASRSSSRRAVLLPLSTYPSPSSYCWLPCTSVSEYSRQSLWPHRGASAVRVLATSAPPASTGWVAACFAKFLCLSRPLASSD